MIKTPGETTKGITTPGVKVKHGFSALVNKSMLESENLVNEIMSLPNFIVAIDNEIFINTTITSPSEVSRFLDDFFSRGGYIEGFGDNYESLMSWMYSQEDSEKNDGGNIKIGKSVKKINEKRKIIYPQPKINQCKNPQDSNAYFIFSKVFVTETLENGDEIEIPTLYDIDEFISMMWGYQIRYGLKIDDISKVIKEVYESTTPNVSKQIYIAESLPSKKGRDGKLVALMNLGLDMSIFTNAIGQGRMDKAVRAIEMIKKGDKLFLYSKAEKGEKGFSIFGETILPEAGSEIDLRVCVDLESIKIEKDNEMMILSARKDGFFHPDDVITHNGEGLGFVTLESIQGHTLKISPEIEIDRVFPSSIDSAPGHVNIKGKIMDSLVSGNNASTLEAEKMAVPNGYKIINANSIKSEGLVQGHMHAFGTIDITGNISGGSVEKNNENGVVVSDNGNVTIDGLVVNGFIRALKGKIELKKRVENSLIVGKEIISSSGAVNTTFICDSFVGKGTYKDCTFIVKTSFEAEQIVIPEGSNNRILIIPEEFSKKELEELDKREKELEELDKREKELEDDIKFKKLLLTYLRLNSGKEIIREDAEFYKNNIVFFQKEFKERLDTQENQEYYKRVLSNSELEDELKKLKEEKQNKQQEYDAKKQEVTKSNINVDRINGAIKVFKLPVSYNIPTLTTEGIFDLCLSANRISDSESSDSISPSNSTYLVEVQKI